MDFSLDFSSINTVNFICKSIFDYENKFKKPNDDEKLKNIDDLNLEFSHKSLPQLEGRLQLINASLNNLFKSSEKDGFYFFDCSLGLYEKLYSIRLIRFLKYHKDSNELDFLEYELDVFNNPNKNRVLTYDYSNFNYSKYLIKNVDFKIALNRKIEFIERRKNMLDKSNYNSNIFRSRLAEDWFNNALDELNALKENMKAGSSFQAKCAAIFDNAECKNLIFKYDLYLKDYIYFLNSIYSANIKTLSKLSDGGKHTNEVTKHINLFKKQWLKNKPE